MEQDQESYAVIGAAIEVFNELGSGFNEIVYHLALAKEFKSRKIPYTSEHPLPVSYKKEVIATYRADFICFDGLLLEIKALTRVGNLETAQVLNYLKASGLRRALLLNFGSPSLQHKRIVYSK